MMVRSFYFCPKSTTRCFVMLGVLAYSQLSQAAGFDSRYELTGTVLPSGLSLANITIDGREPRYPETFIGDMDGDGVPEFIAFPGGSEAGVCRPLLIALSSVRNSNNIDSSDSRYITISDANGAVSSDSFCTDIETFETIGDMDGDGFAEFALQSSGTYVVQGVQNLSGEIKLTELDGNNGFLVRNALLRQNLGDINGDGLDELSLVEFDPDGFDFGDEYILKGRTGTRAGEINPDNDVTNELLARIFNGTRNFVLLEPLGDINGDGIDDVLVRQSDNLNIIYGAVDLQIAGNVLSDPLTPALGQACGFFGCNALGNFDFDADGYNDLAMTFGPDTTDTSVILYGGAEGLPDNNALANQSSLPGTILTGTPRLSSGFVDTFGDINGDGADDVYFSSGADTVVLFGTPGRRVREINIDSLDGSNGFTAAFDQVQVSDTFRPYIYARNMIADLNDDGTDDYIGGRVLVEGLDDAPSGNAPMGILVRQGPDSADLFWQVLDTTEAIAGFRISAEETVLAELPATASSYRVNIISTEQSRDIRIGAVDADGLELGASVRRLQAFGSGFAMRGEVYGPNLLELIWDAPVGDYLVWRDGEVYKQVNGNSYLDTDVQPGVVHEYFVTEDVLTGGDATSVYLNSLEGLQRRSSIVSIEPPPRADDTFDPEKPEPPMEGRRPDVPTGLTGIVYSATAAEIFWQRVINVPISRYDVYRNGDLLVSVDALSWFDDELEPDSTYRYSVVAVSSDGIGSLASTTLMLQSDYSEAAPDTTDVQPTGLSGSVYSSSAVELFWDRDIARSQTYVVLANGVDIGSTDGTSFYINGLNPGEEYEFSVIASGAGNPLAAAKITLTLFE